MQCDECKQERPEHECYGGDGRLVVAELVATNSGQSWRKRMCHECWTAFQSRAFCSITRKGNTFTATCAF